MIYVISKKLPEVWGGHGPLPPPSGSATGCQHTDYQIRRSVNRSLARAVTVFIGPHTSQKYRLEWMLTTMQCHQRNLELDVSRTVDQLTLVERWYNI